TRRRRSKGEEGAAVPCISRDLAFALLIGISAEVPFSLQPVVLFSDWGRVGAAGIGSAAVGGGPPGLSGRATSLPLGGLDERRRAQYPADTGRRTELLRWLAYSSLEKRL